jgi:WD40 repeat protein
VQIIHEIRAMAQVAAALREPAGFHLLQHGHSDMVEAAEFNSYGNRFALGSADGRIKVYDRMRDGTWRICDTWVAHSAEVHEVGLQELH